MSTPNYAREEIGYTGPSFPWRMAPSGAIETATVDVQNGNIELLAEAITQIIRTKRGERFFRRGWGAEPVNIVFRPNSEAEMLLVASEIEEILSAYEPRVRLIEFSVVEQQADQGYVALRIGFEHLQTQLVDYVEVTVS